VGDFENDKQHGLGIFTWPSGTLYEGQCRDSMFNGQGKTIFACGDSYVGEYKNDRYNGTGIFTWASGKRYEGTFVDDL